MWYTIVKKQDASVHFKFFGKEADFVLANFLDFLNGVKEARFTFQVIRQWLTSVFEAVTANADILGVWNGIMTLIAPIHRTVVIIAIILCLLSTFFGRKLMGVIKFLLFFVLGFTLSVQFIAPLVPTQIHIAPWIIGLVVALVAAVLSRFLYTLLYLVFFSYGTYTAVFSLLLLDPSATYTDTKAVVCLLISIAVTVIAFVFRGYVEMALTAIFGAWATVVLFTGSIYNFTLWPLFGGDAGLAIFIATALLSALGLLVQIVTRRRY
jgi:hypothetical protein